MVADALGEAGVAGAMDGQAVLNDQSADPRSVVDLGADGAVADSAVADSGLLGAVPTWRSPTTYELHDRVSVGIVDHPVELTPDKGPIGRSSVAPLPDRSLGAALIVARDGDEADRLRLLLHRGGYADVQLAATGAEAIELAARSGPSLVLLGPELADAAGLELAAELKRGPRPRPRVIGLKGPNGIDWAAGERGGAVDDCVAWPLDPDVLLAQVRATRQLRALDIDRLDRFNELLVLEELGQALQDGSPLEDNLERGTRQLLRLSGVDLAAIQLEGRDRVVWTLRETPSSAGDRSATAATDADIRTLICGGRQAEFSPFDPETVSTSTMGGDARGVARRLALETLVRVPLIAGRQSIGLLVVGRRDHGAYTPRQVARLRHVAGQLTAMIEHARLIEDVGAARKQAEEADRQVQDAASLTTVGRMASSIVHQLTQPLTAVTAMLELLGEEKRLSPDGQELVQRMQRSLTRMEQTASHVLRFARRAGAVMGDVDVRAILDEALGLVEHDFRLADIEVERHYRADLPTVHGDADELGHLFLNLLTNARDAMHDRSGRVIITTELVSSGDGPEQVAVSVRDQGLGIPEHLKARVFEPRFTTKARGQGTGLGLGICERIVRRHGGSIEVESAEGAGACFRVLLPAGAPAPLPARSVPHAPNAP